MSSTWKQTKAFGRLMRHGYGGLLYSMAFSVSCLSINMTATHYLLALKHCCSSDGVVNSVGHDLCGKLKCNNQ